VTAAIPWLHECACGSQTAPARAPSGRHVELEITPVTIADGAPWPNGRLFTLIHRVDDQHPEPYYAKPVNEMFDRRLGTDSGPYYRPHVCP
jgi:hypothetical protein